MWIDFNFFDQRLYCENRLSSNRFENADIDSIIRVENLVGVEVFVQEGRDGDA